MGGFGSGLVVVAADEANALHFGGWAAKGNAGHEVAGGLGGADLGVDLIARDEVGGQHPQRTTIRAAFGRGGPVHAVGARV